MILAKALLQENHMTDRAEMETLTEQSVPQYIASNCEAASGLVFSSQIASYVQFC